MTHLVAVDYLHESLGHSRGQFEDHNSSQRTHHTDRWMCQEHLSIIKHIIYTRTHIYLYVYINMHVYANKNPEDWYTRVMTQQVCLMTQNKINIGNITASLITKPKVSAIKT